MNTWLVSVLTGYPVLTLFLVIGLGYVLGEFSLFGFRLGVAGVLFVGLAVGSLDPAIALPELVSTLGLIIFVYSIGIHSGPAFFASFRKQGYRDSLLVVAMLAFASLCTLGLAAGLGLDGPRATGLFCGALTNTPALAAAREVVRDRAEGSGLSKEDARRASDRPVVAYSIAYPVGVIGVLLCFQVTRKLWRVKPLPRQELPEIMVRDFVVKNPGVAGRTVAEVLGLHHDLGFVVSRIQHEGATGIAKSDTRLCYGDLVAVVGDEESLGRAEHIFGEKSDSHIELDHSELDARRVYVSSKEVVGKRIRELDLQNRFSATVTRLRRGDIDLVPSPDTRLELGDSVRVLTRKQDFPAVAKFLGDSIRGTAETDFGSVAIGMVLGVMAGMMPIPLPGGGTLRLGLAGGPLLVALLLGKLERSGRITWVMPFSANLTLRQIGLLLFMAGIGTKAGYSFAETLRANGAELLLAGAGLTFAVALATLVVGYKILAIPFDSVMGIVSGLQTQPACLAYATSHTDSDAPNVAYAGVYPAAMIAKIILAQLLASWLPWG